jgi:hypothetical protein
VVKTVIGWFTVGRWLSDGWPAGVVVVEGRATRSTVGVGLVDA